MKIDTLKDLEKVISLCRKLGVESIKIDNVEFHLGQLPAKAKKVKSLIVDTFSEADIKVPQYTPVTNATEADRIVTDELTEEQLMFYSAQSHNTEDQQTGTGQ
jgi:hypothetical protein